MELYMNMNIDDVIKSLKNGEYLTNREQEQIAAWLEELKTLRLDSCMIHLPERLQLVENGYRKGIDDFADKLLSQPIVDRSVVRRIKEQLKGE